MCKDKTVAILLATYNGEKYIEQQLLSIINQTYTNLHIYISDDASIDNTVTIVKKYADLYPNKISLNINKDNIGYIANFNLLISLCQEDYIAFSDQDDIWETNKIEIELNTLLKQESLHKDKCIMVHSDLSCINENNQEIYQSFFKHKHYHFSNKKSIGAIIGYCGIMGNTMLFNKKLKELVGELPKDIDFHDYFISIINECFGKRVTIKKPLVKYRIHGDNYSSNSLRKKSTYSGLPFKNTKKIDTLKYVINYPISKKDRVIIYKFMKYLKAENCGLKDYLFLLKTDILKQNFKCRLKVFFKFLKNKKKA